mmetsp:Transcript_58347/g.168975  ORF Transcript_58347/g.168975 Transcript_58347/m.168975 type:complete len:209 (+) Transcript_58347:134-760(+)
MHPEVAQPRDRRRLLLEIVKMIADRPDGGIRIRHRELGIGFGITQCIFLVAAVHKPGLCGDADFNPGDGLYVVLFDLGAHPHAVVDPSVLHRQNSGERLGIEHRKRDLHNGQFLMGGGLVMVEYGDHERLPLLPTDQVQLLVEDGILRVLYHLRAHPRALLSNHLNCNEGVGVVRHICSWQARRLDQLDLNGHPTHRRPPLPGGATIG